MIASVAFRNFKALRSTRLALAPFNLVIGPNGSGKTSLIQAVLRLRTLARWPEQLGATHGGPEDGPEIEFQFTAPHDALEVRISCQADLVCNRIEIVPPGAPDWPALRGEIAGIRSYLFDHYALAAPTARSEGGELTSNGGNLAAVLDEMERRQPQVLAAITGEMRRLLPEFSGIELVEAGSDQVALTMRLSDGELVAAESLSQGTLYALALLVLVHSDRSPTLVCVEEIDRGIHPRMLREIRDVLYRLSYPASCGLTRKPVQVIATTHSPYMLDLFRDHPDEVVLAHKEGVTARFERLADRENLGELLREGSLGDMWFSGILGGVPEEK